MQGTVMEDNRDFIGSPQEFSDESLFGEDVLSELMEKKSSMIAKGGYDPNRVSGALT